MFNNCNSLTIKAKLLCTLAWRLAQAGAETRLIIQSLYKVSKALDVHCQEIGINRSGVIVKIQNGDESAIEFKEIKFFGINMSQVSKLHRICLRVERKELVDLRQIFHEIRAVRPVHYPKNLLIFIEALAGVAFAYLNGASVTASCCAFVGGLVLMFTRFFFIKRHYFENFAFMISAFCGCLVTYVFAKYVVNLPQNEISVPIIATCLLLVPGFPFINGFLDMFKGYIDTGVIRLLHALVLTMSAAIGLIGALLLTTGMLQC